MPYEAPFTPPDIPGLFLKITNELALGDVGEQHRVLVVGTRLASGTAAALAPVRVTKAEQADVLWGPGGMLAEQVRAVFATIGGEPIEVWGIGLDEVELGAAAQAQLTFTGSASGAGEVRLTIGGQLVREGVPEGTTAAQLAGYVAAKMAELPRLPCTGELTDTAITLTCKWKGETGNAVAIRSLQLPPGVTVEVTGFAGGAADPEVADALAMAGTQHFRTVALGYVDILNLQQLDGWLAVRWEPLVQREGLGFSASCGTFGELLAIAEQLNSKFLVVGAPGPSTTPPWVIAAATAGIDARVTWLEPNRPRLDETLVGVQPVPESLAFDDTERATLLAAGLSTFRGTVDGRLVVERLVTTATLDDQGQPDRSYWHVDVLRVLGYCRASLQRLRWRYKHWKVAKDETLARHPRVLTPAKLTAALVGLYAQWMSRALVQDMAAFKAGLIVEIAPNGTDFVVFVPLVTVRGLNAISGELAYV